MAKYKDFSTSKIISFDCETHDPNLLSTGPSVKSGGFILGIGLADETGFSEYYPLKHIETTEEERKKNLDFLKDVFENSVPKLAMNILYDMDWVCNYLGFKINGKLYDIMIAEGLINENQAKYSLDYMATKYLQKQKYEDEIKRWCDIRDLKGAPQSHLAKMPAQLVGIYCIEDCLLPIEIFRIQKRILEDENLLNLFDMEMRLIPMLIYMRDIGIRTERSKIYTLEEYVAESLFNAEEKLNNLAGFELNYRSANQIGEVCDKLNISYPRTEKTDAPSFQKIWLETNKDNHELFKLILNCRKYHKILTTFIESQIIGQIQGDRIYAQFHSMKSSYGGTVTGRFSSSKPNLQFIPNPKSEINEGEDINLGTALRGMFLPEEDHVWGKIDYSQIEIRMLAHYAIGEKSEDIRQKYKNKESVDYHQWCADIAGIDRHRAKKINFSIIYGMGVKGIAAKLGLDYESGKEFFDGYLYDLPFIKKTLLEAKSVAESRGYVKTILGRRRRFPDRNHSYKALNAIIQGGAADIMKKAMVDSFEAGIYDILIPHLTVHDELDFSIPKSKLGIQAVEELKYIMENTIKLNVPVVADCEAGEDWGAVSEGAYIDLLRGL